MRIFLYGIIILASLTFAGCSSAKFSSYNLISFDKQVKLNTGYAWPLHGKGTYIQKVTASMRGQQQTFSIHLTLDDWMLETIAFNDMAGRLYKLKWTPYDLIWERSPQIPSIIKAEDILVDFLLANLPAHQLKYALKGASFFEMHKHNPGGKIRIVKKRRVLRKITYDQPIGALCGHVIIENPIVGYKLDIQTVVQ